MELHEVKEHLQGHLSDGLVVIVGSGLSCAEGMPGMSELATQLKDKVPALINEQDRTIWDEVVVKLDSGSDLEQSLLEVKVGKKLEKAIVDVTHKFIHERESDVINKVFNEGKVLRFSRLLPHLLITDTGIPVVTTNYDRLIEIASERAEVSVDNTFSGRYVSVFDQRKSKLELCIGTTQKKRKTLLKYSKFISVFKPHGSLDWYMVNDDPVCTSLFVAENKLIITPGANKFRGGYEIPFDRHRECANNAVDNGRKYLVIGYGFNDEHLQIHLEKQMEKGKSTVVLTHSIPDKFKNYIRGKDNIWVVCSIEEKKGFQLIIGDSEYEFEGSNIWDLEIFVKEVLENG